MLIQQKKEALENFIKRNERRIKILKYQAWSCEIAVYEAKSKFSLILNEN